MKTPKLPVFTAHIDEEEDDLSVSCYLCGRTIPEEEVIPNEKPICDICEAEYEYGM